MPGFFRLEFATDTSLLKHQLFPQNAEENVIYAVSTREPVNPLSLFVFLMILGERLPVRKWADP